MHNCLPTGQFVRNYTSSVQFSSVRSLCTRLYRGSSDHGVNQFSPLLSVSCRLRHHAVTARELSSQLLNLSTLCYALFDWCWQAYDTNPWCGRWRCHWRVRRRCDCAPAPSARRTCSVAAETAWLTWPATARLTLASSSTETEPRTASDTCRPTPSDHNITTTWSIKTQLRTFMQT